MALETPESTITCDSCGYSEKLKAPTVPPGWFQDEKGGHHCPMHQLTVVAVDLTDEEEIVRRVRVGMIKRESVIRRVDAGSLPHDLLTLLPASNEQETVE